MNEERTLRNKRIRLRILNETNIGVYTYVMKKVFILISALNEDRFILEPVYINEKQFYKVSLVLNVQETKINNDGLVADLMEDILFLLVGSFESLTIKEMNDAKVLTRIKKLLDEFDNLSVSPLETKYQWDM